MQFVARLMQAVMMVLQAIRSFPKTATARAGKQMAQPFNGDGGDRWQGDYRIQPEVRSDRKVTGSEYPEVTAWLN